jgi:integration host factor subunit beta
VTRKEIVRSISEELDLSQMETKQIVQMVFDAILHTLVEVGRVELRNFGVFEVKRRGARKARNPRTGEKVFVPEKLVVTFKPGQVMQKRVEAIGQRDDAGDERH